MEPLVVEEKRGTVVEAIHRVHAIAICDGRPIFQCGNPDILVPMRSTAKPFMMLPLLNACNTFGVTLSKKQLSIIASSHNGEKAHRDCVLSILDLADCKASDLYCGYHLPFYNWLYEDFFSERDPAQRQLFHNCSGKHAGMLLLSKLLGIEKKGYWQIDNPVQQAIYSSVQEIFQLHNGHKIQLALDGCGVPTYCVPLCTIANAYQRLYKLGSLLPIMEAIIEEPFYIAGTERIETKIITECKYIAKSGSSGLFAVSCPAQDISIVLKIEDGNDDAAEAAIVGLLEKLDLLSGQQQLTLSSYKELPITTSTNQLAGYYHCRDFEN